MCLAVKDNTIVVGMYLGDGANFYGPDRDYIIAPGGAGNYLPIVDTITINTNGGIKFVKVDGVYEEELNTRNTNFIHRAQQHTSSVANKKYIDIKHNDLLTGSITLVVNLTNHPVTVSTPGAVAPTLHKPSDSDMTNLNGDLHILKVHTISNPAFVSSYGGDSNYLVDCKAVLESRGEYYGLQKAVIDFVILNLPNIKAKAGKSNSLSPGSVDISTVKVVTVTTIKGSVVEGNERIRLDDIDMFVLNKPNPAGIITQMKPETNKVAVMLSGIPDGNCNPVIVDRHSQLKDKFITIANLPCKVPRVHEKDIGDHEDGIYMVNKSGGFKLEKIGPLSYAVPAHGYYNTQEEALAGTTDQQHIAEMNQRQQDLEVSRHNLEMEKIDLSRQVVDLNRQLEAAKVTTTVVKHETDRRKFHLDSASMEDKSYYDRQALELKRDYESSKYQDEKTIDQLKLGLGVTAVILGGYALATKLGK